MGVLMRRFLLACASALCVSAAGAATPSWVAESNRHSKALLEMMAAYAPEDIGQLGLDGIDGKVLDIGPRFAERFIASAARMKTSLQRQLASTTVPEVRQDLAILIEAVDRYGDGVRLEQSLSLPYFNVTKKVFGGIQSLLDPRIPKPRQAFAVERLRRYAGLEPGSRPVTQHARERTEERLRVKGLVGPYRAEVEQYLADAAALISGVRELLEKSGLEGWQQPMATLTRQLDEYHAWVRRVVLPRTRSDNRLPPALYAHALRQFGVTVPPKELISLGQLAYAEILNEMRALAPLVAKQNGFASSDYRDVIRELKKRSPGDDAIVPAYEKTLAAIEDTLKRERIVSVPARKASIRLATEAESADVPSPQMSTPRLIGNTGEYGEFLLPRAAKGANGQAPEVGDDSFEAATWTLTAHEARPGHEMQFSAMVERGVSTARAVFAFTSANVEGWALYSEAEMKPYFPLDGQLIGLQARLMRAARAFLDPQLNLGLITPDQARQLLRDQVVLSPATVKEEVDRCTFRSPGQATSYLFGYQALMRIRQSAELKLGAAFERQRFHDFVLAQGLLPLDLLAQEVDRRFVAEEAKRTR
jgi:hypothetical protein